MATRRIVALCVCLVALILGSKISGGCLLWTTLVSDTYFFFSLSLLSCLSFLFTPISSLSLFLLFFSFFFFFLNTPPFILFLFSNLFNRRSHLQPCSRRPLPAFVSLGRSFSSPPRSRCRWSCKLCDRFWRTPCRCSRWRALLASEGGTRSGIIGGVL